METIARSTAACRAMGKQTCHGRRIEAEDEPAQLRRPRRVEACVCALAGRGALRLGQAAGYDLAARSALFIAR